MFGGLAQNGSISDQTWIYGGGCWENVFPSGPKGVYPAARWDAMMAYDAADGYIVMYGGCRGARLDGFCAASLGDTWKFSTGRWALLVASPGENPPPGIPAAPSPRWDAAMTWVNELQSVVLFGGASGLHDTPPTPGPTGTCGSVPVLDGDTWEYTEGSGAPTWTEISTGNSLTSDLFGSRIADDPQYGGAILFGGSDFYRTTDDGCTPTVLGSVMPSSGSNPWPNSPGTLELNEAGWAPLNLSKSIPYPEGRFDANVACDGHGHLLLEGGADTYGTVDTDLWEFTGMGSFWRNLTNGSATDQPVNGTPIPRYGAGFVWDAADGYFLMTGGTTASGSVVGDSWSLSLVGPFSDPQAVWTLETPVAHLSYGAPPARYEAAMAWDDALDAVVLFGGESCGATACRFLGDTWLYDGGYWSELATSEAPPASFGASMDYDPGMGTILLFGGCGVTCPLGETWELAPPGAGRAPVWHRVFPVIAPPARYFAAMAYDAYDSQTVLFGGCEGSPGACPTGDTWVFEANRTVWKLVPAPFGAPVPEARFGAAAGSLVRSTRVDTTFNGILLFGGQAEFGMLGDTWNFSGGTWSEIASYNATPNPRVFGTLVDNGQGASLLLIGGCESGQCPAMDIWTFALNPPSPPPPPPPPPAPLIAAHPLFSSPNPSPWSFTNLTETIGVVPALPPPGPARYGMAAAWDPTDGPGGFVLLEGGRLSNGESSPEVDMIGGSLWTKMVGYG
jgi:hypothetical protein